MFLVKINYSPVRWGFLGAISIALTFYLVQVLGMQSWLAPVYFMKVKWYFVLPLILAFGIQLGLFRVMYQQAQRAGGVVAATGGVSITTMIACCLHNLVVALPFLGLTGVAVFFSAYLDYIFTFSILFALGGIIFMWQKYQKHRLHCRLNF